jgi:hypothetical protein
VTSRVPSIPGIRSHEQQASYAETRTRFARKRGSSDWLSIPEGTSRSFVEGSPRLLCAPTEGFQKCSLPQGSIRRGNREGAVLGARRRWRRAL